jgi:hypothetical protein
VIRRLRDELGENFNAVTAVMGLAVAVLLLSLLAACDRAPAKPPETAAAAPYTPQPTVIEYGDLRVTAAAGSPVDIETTGSAEGVGHGVTTNAPDVVAQMDLSAPFATLDSATGGGITYAMQLTGATEGAIVVWVIAAVFLAFGAFIAYRGNFKLGVYIAACGPALVGCWTVADRYPWLILLAALLALAGVVAYVVWSLRTASALGSVVTGIETAPPGIAEVVKGNIAKFSDPAVKATIRAAKAKEGIV